MDEKVPVKERLKSWAVWASVLGALSIILNSFGVFEMIGLSSTEFDIIVNALGTILVTFGILNNPTDRAHF